MRGQRKPITEIVQRLLYQGKFENAIVQVSIGRVIEIEQ